MNSNEQQSNNGPVTAAATAAAELEQLYANDPAIKECLQRIEVAKKEDAARKEILRAEIAALRVQSKAHKKQIQKLQAECGNIATKIVKRHNIAQRDSALVRSLEKRINRRKQTIQRDHQKAEMKKINEEFRSQWRQRLNAIKKG